MTTYLPTDREELVLKARCVHDRLGDKFYYIFRIFPCHLKNGLLFMLPVQDEITTALAQMGFQQDEDFGVVVTRTPGLGVDLPPYGYSNCSGVSFSVDEGWRADDNWSESLVSDEARNAYYALEALIKRAREDSEKAVDESRFQAAVLERIPARVIDWARKARKPNYEIALIRRSVSTLRAGKIDEDVIQAALSHPSFSQELIRLTRSIEGTS